jgi:ABC-type transport system involved in multi-copper enzyme maturation permease subunit
MGPVLSIALNTYRETIRNKVLYILLLFAIIIMLSGHFFADISLHNEKRVLYDIGLGLLSIFSILIAIFTGVNIIYKEIEKKTIYLILPKPVSRPSFILGKLFGLLAAVYLITSIMLLLLVFEVFLIKIPISIHIFKAALLIYFEVLIILSIAILFSSFSTPYITGMLTLGVFFIGRLLPDLLQVILIKYESNTVRTVVEEVLQFLPHLYLYVPNGHMFNGKYVSITADFVSWGFVGYAFLYSLIYSSIILSISSFILNRRNLT